MIVLYRLTLYVVCVLSLQSCQGRSSGMASETPTHSAISTTGSMDVSPSLLDMDSMSKAYKPNAHQGVPDRVGSPFIYIHFKDEQPDWVVPLWIDLTAETRPECSAMEWIDISVTEIPGNRLFICQQPDVLCDTYMHCRSRGLYVGSSWDTGPHRDDDVFQLTGDVYLSSTYMEGGAYMYVFRWNLDDTETMLLPFITHDVEHDSEADQILIKSACHPKTGLSTRSYSESECGPNDECGYCDMMYGKPSTWVWSPGQEPVLQ